VAGPHHSGGGGLKTAGGAAPPENPEKRKPQIGKEEEKTGGSGKEVWRLSRDREEQVKLWATIRFVPWASSPSQRMDVVRISYLGPEQNGYHAVRQPE
jgi:hypothetical protein